MADGFDFTVRTMEDLAAAVERFGIVPLFRNAIPGFSVEEHTAPEAWFPEDREGVWDWKGPVIRGTGCAYGKFFERKAAFVSRAWFPDLANYRRDGYDFDARFDDGLASWADRTLFELVDGSAPVVSRRLKELGGYGKNGRRGFDTSMNRLQAQCYVTITDFVYAMDRYGRPYGWGTAVYSTPERAMGSDFTDRVYAREPEESYESVLAHLLTLCPDAGEEALRRFLR